MHQNHPAEKINRGSLQTTWMLHQMQTSFHLQGVDDYIASRRALAALYRIVQRHASMLAFVEAFWSVGIMFVVMVLFILGFRNPRAKPDSRSIRPPSRVVAEPTAQQQEEDELVLVD